MAVIFAEKRNEPGGPDARRRAGTQDLGDRIIFHTGAGNYAAGVRQALHELVQDTNNYIVYYGYREGNAGKTHTISSVDPAPGQGSPPVITCNLLNTTKKLKLHIRVDKSDANNFNMDVVFPDTGEVNGFDYLLETARDVLALNNDTNAQKYLAAFKFLSRCK